MLLVGGMAMSEEMGAVVPENEVTTTIHVDVNSRAPSESADGSEKQPFLSLARAAEKARFPGPSRRAALAGPTRFDQWAVPASRY